MHDSNTQAATPCAVVDEISEPRPRFIHGHAVKVDLVIDAEFSLAQLFQGGGLHAVTGKSQLIRAGLNRRVGKNILDRGCLIG